jgi:acyl-CoA synthetase (NDP forming)
MDSLQSALRDEQSLGTAFGEMQRRVAALGQPVADYLVQEMIADGVEVFAGVARDPDFGLSLAFGLGGVGVEVLRDFALRHACRCARAMRRR